MQDPRIRDMTHLHRVPSMDPPTRRSLAVLKSRRDWRETTPKFVSMRHDDTRRDPASRGRLKEEEWRDDFHMHARCMTAMQILRLERWKGSKSALASETRDVEAPTPCRLSTSQRHVPLHYFSSDVQAYRKGKDMMLVQLMALPV